jgi:enoyl reductase-like protein
MDRTKYTRRKLMSNHAPIDEPIRQILDAYNPLEIKDILLHGSWRKAIHHKDWDDVLAYYKDNIDYMHHYLLDSPDAWNHYGMMQKAYSMTDHTMQDQKDYIKDVFYLYLDVLASDIGHKWDLHSRPRKEIEDEVLAIELKIRKDSLGIIDGGKS